MQAAQVIGGYSLGGADLLRRAMGKKKPEEMAKHREIFAEGAAKQGINRQKADEIFDYMEKFAGYGFNKSHAAAYALISYQTAWLKAHYPAEFMAATMSSELDNTDQLKLFYDDAVANGIEFLPPDINESVYRFIPCGNKQIRYALGAVKGTGEGAVEAIIEARNNGGAFTGLLDFCERVGKAHINKRTVESLIRAGAFDCLNPNRAMLIANIELAMGHAEQKAANANQGGLFDFVEDAIEPVQLEDTAPWGESLKLSEEKQVLGFYFSGHPFGPYAGEVRQFAPVRLSKLKPQDHVRVAGFATAIRTMLGKRGKIAFITLEDNGGRTEVMVSGEALEECASYLKADQVLIAECKISRDDYNGGDALRIMANHVMTLQTARERYARSLSLMLRPEHDIRQLARLLESYQQAGESRIPLKLSYQNSDAAGELKVAGKWSIVPKASLFASLETLLGERLVRVDW